MAKLNDLEMDALREVGNVGVGNAATALSKMINKKIDISIPSTEFVPIGKFSDVAGGAETIVYCLYLKITGDVTGRALLIFNESSTKRFVDILMGKTMGETKELTDMDLSSIMEMSNIVIGSYLSSMANMLEYTILPNPPSTAYDMLQAVIDSVLAEMSKSADEILYIKTNMIIEEDKVDGTMVLLFTEDSLNNVLDKLHKMYGV